jgi:hypothetical protein
MNNIGTRYSNEDHSPPAFDMSRHPIVIPEFGTLSCKHTVRTMKRTHLRNVICCNVIVSYRILDPIISWIVLEFPWGLRSFDSGTPGMTPVPLGK